MFKKKVFVSLSLLNHITSKIHKRAFGITMEIISYKINKFNKGIGDRFAIIKSFFNFIF